jgi:hypothetical protein
MDFPAIKNIGYKTDMEKVEMILQVYSTLKGISLREFEKAVLKYYLVYGYEKETKQMITEYLNKKDGNIRVVDTWLREKGFLEHGRNNKRKSKLSPDMEAIREAFIVNNQDVYVLTFKRL